MTDEEYEKKWDAETKLTSCEMEAISDQRTEAIEKFKETCWVHPVTKTRTRYSAEDQTAMALWAIAEELKLISMCLRRAYPPLQEQETISPAPEVEKKSA